MLRYAIALAALCLVAASTFAQTPARPPLKAGDPATGPARTDTMTAAPAPPDMRAVEAPEFTMDGKPIYKSAMATPDQICSGLVISSNTLTTPIAGVPVAIPYTVRSVLAGSTVKFCVLGKLANLQQKIGAIVDTFHLPTDNCAHYSLNNPVVSLSSVTLTYVNGKASLNLSGKVVLWGCAKNPIPNSKVEWQIKKIGPIKTKVPVVVTWPADPIKTVIGTQPFTAHLLFSPVIVDLTHVGLKLDSAQIDLQGQYAYITNGVLYIAGIDINTLAYNALKNIVGTAQIAVPNGFTVVGTDLTNPSGVMTIRIWN